MKSFIVLLALFAGSLAAPQSLIAPGLVATSPLVNQYHTQDSLGQYAYGYNGLTSSKVESRSLDGVTRGSYSYVDPENKLQTVNYAADALNGFRVAATNLPKGPEAPIATITRPIAPIAHPIATVDSIYPTVRAFSPYAARAIVRTVPSGFSYSTLRSPLIVAHPLVHDNAAPIVPYQGSPIPLSRYLF